MYQKCKLGIVVLAYNEEALIAETLGSMPAYADRIYVIDDGSADKTSDVVRTLSHLPVTLLRHETNRGPGAAIATGYKAALADGMDIVVKLDGDSQMDTKHLPSLLEPILEGKADYTKGNRLSKLSHRRGMSNWRFFGNWVLTLLTKISSGYWKISDSQNGYTAITIDALKQIELDNLYPRYGYLNDLLARLNVAGCRVIDVPMPARYGNEKSKIGYIHFIPRVSLLLLRCWLWRVRRRRALELYGQSRNPASA